jgi:hypothetical protein
MSIMMLPMEVSSLIMETRSPIRSIVYTAHGRYNCTITQQSFDQPAGDGHDFVDDGEPGSRLSTATFVAV